MSASDKKRLRKEQQAAAMTEKQQKALKEAKSLKTYTITFVVVMLLIVAIVLGLALRVPVLGMIDRGTHAVTIGDNKLSSTEFNYYYTDAITTFYNGYYSQYSSYASMLPYLIQMYTGLDITKPLSSQKYDATTGQTWADYFIDEATKTASWTYAVYNKAMSEGFKLPADEQKYLDSFEESMEYYATYSGFSNLNAYLRSIYSDGANFKTYFKYYEMCTIAASYANAHRDSYKFDDAAIRAHDSANPLNFNSYSYNLVTLNIDSYLKFLCKGTSTEKEDGSITITYSDEEKATALAAMKADMELLTGKDINTLEELNDAVRQLAINQKKEDDKTDKNDKEDEKTDPTESTGTTDSTEGTEATDGTEATEGTDASNPTDPSTPSEDKGDSDTPAPEKNDKTDDSKLTIKVATEVKRGLYTNLNKDFKTWLSASGRKNGDTTSVEIKTTTDGKEAVTGFYILMFTEASDNTMKLANVRHLLIKFDSDKQADKDKAKAEAEALLKTFREGDTSEEAFIALVKEKTEDTASKSTGGLYENISPDDSYVEPFLDWCFEKHEKGDLGLVETEYGWHIMFYVGGSEMTYRDTMIHQILVNEAYTAWEEALVATMPAVTHNLSKIDKDFIISAAQ